MRGEYFTRGGLLLMVAVLDNIHSTEAASALFSTVDVFEAPKSESCESVAQGGIRESGQRLQASEHGDLGR